MPNRSAFAYVAPFFLFMLLLGVSEAFRAIFRHGSSFALAAPQYWIYPAQTILCGAVMWHFRSSYRFGWPKKIGLTLLIAVLVLGIWIAPQELLGAHRRYDGFDPTVFENNPKL